MAACAPAPQVTPESPPPITTAAAVVQCVVDRNLGNVGRVGQISGRGGAMEWADTKGEEWNVPLDLVDGALSWRAQGLWLALVAHRQEAVGCPRDEHAGGVCYGIEVQ
jgi:hypothetical protein